MSNESTEELTSFVYGLTNKFRQIQWNYGSITLHLKAMYINDFIEKILNFVQNRKMKIKDIEQSLKLIFNKIEYVELNLKSIDFNESFTKINVFNNKMLKYRYLKFFRVKKPKNSEEDEEDFQEIYENLIKEYGPVYTILVNKHNSKYLKRIPIELVRYLNMFL